MQHRLTHQMKIEELYLTLQTVCQGVELLERQPAFLSVGLGAEQTVEVTYICYFKITTGYHLFRNGKLIKAYSEDCFNYICIRGIGFCSSCELLYTSPSEFAGNLF